MVPCLVQIENNEWAKIKRCSEEKNFYRRDEQQTWMRILSDNHYSKNTHDSPFLSTSLLSNSGHLLVLSKIQVPLLLLVNLQFRTHI